MGEPIQQGRRSDLVQGLMALEKAVQEGGDWEHELTHHADVKVRSFVFRHHRHCEEYVRASSKADRAKLKNIPPLVWVFYGETGTGKSHCANKLAKGSTYNKPAGLKGWWGPDAEFAEVINMDDFRCELPYAEALQLFDPAKYACEVQKKGGVVDLSAITAYIITSPMPPWNPDTDEQIWYKDATSADDSFGQLRRRIDGITKFPLTDAPFESDEYRKAEYELFRRMGLKYQEKCERFASRDDNGWYGRGLSACANMPELIEDFTAEEGRELDALASAAYVADAAASELSIDSTPADGTARSPPSGLQPSPSTPALDVHEAPAAEDERPPTRRRLNFTSPTVVVLDETSDEGDTQPPTLASTDDADLSLPFETQPFTYDSASDGEAEEGNESDWTVTESDDDDAWVEELDPPVWHEGVPDSPPVSPVVNPQRDDDEEVIE
jgi:hypothetical protein